MPRNLDARLLELTARLDRQERELNALLLERGRHVGPVSSEHKSSRRDLFKLAAAGAAGAAATAVLGAESAAAADGQAMLLGSSGGVQDHATSVTSITLDSLNAGGTAFLVSADGATGSVANINAVEGVGKGAGAGLQGFGGANSGPGLGATGGAPNGNGITGGGVGTGTGVAAGGGSSSGTGVDAQGGAPNGIGLNANGAGTGTGIVATGGQTSGVGVNSSGGFPNGAGITSAGQGTGTGIAATGGGASGTGVVANGGGPNGNGARLTGGGTGAPLNLAPNGVAGPPTSGPHAAGDLMVDLLGVVWACVAGGTPGAFVPLQQGGSNTAHFVAVSSQQYRLGANNGNAWADMDSTNLKLSITPGFKCQAVISGNSDLWTAQASVNQDLGIFISGGTYGGGQLVAWKESGGSSTFSPNAAFVETTQLLQAGTTYTIKLQWKANRAVGANLVYAGAGSNPFSPTRLAASLIVTQ